MEDAASWLIDIAAAPRRRQRGHLRIELDTTPVPVKGEALTEIWWRGRQWAVTAFGIEALDGTYALAAKQLLDGFRNNQPCWYDTLPLQIDFKPWVDIDEFFTAWMVALFLHGLHQSVTPGHLREIAVRLRKGQPRR